MLDKIVHGASGVGNDGIVYEAGCRDISRSGRGSLR